MKEKGRYGAAIAGVLLLGSWGRCASGAESMDPFLDAPLEELLSMEVTSVARKKQRLDEVAAAIFVITRDDIRRSGVTSIPEALRLAPGIQVARISASKWAITARGFNSQFANKLLVMIDGRTVYSPAFSGVYWDVQDTFLEDIDRIEVIRGPGASIWGANAVNGVINIITRDAASTQGGLAVFSVGDEEKGRAGVRLGLELGEGTVARAWVGYREVDSSWSPKWRDTGDSWRNLRGGFRVDGQPSPNTLWTLQGDLYDNKEHQLVNEWKDPADPANAPFAPFYVAPGVRDEERAKGWNLLARWEHRFSSTSNLQLQVYYDHAERSEFLIDQTHDTIDIDIQHQWQPFPGHDLNWGLEYRRIRDDFDSTFLITMLDSPRQTSNLFSAFVQDEIELVPERLRLVLGAKLEDHEYTGLELQPTLRLLWMPQEGQTLWAAVSRAVRTPSRLERSVRMVGNIVPAMPPVLPEPQVLYIHGNRDFGSEKLIAWELGYRFQWRENLSLDMASFYHQYQDLAGFRKIQPQMPVSDIMFDNSLTADSWGVELVLDWWPMEWWRLQGSYSYLRVLASQDSSVVDPVDDVELAEESSPGNQYSIRSMMDLGNSLSLDLWLYRVGALGRTSYTRLRTSSIPAYTSFNVRLGWKPYHDLEIALVGQNLFDSHHPEFAGEDYLPLSEVERSFHATLRWHF